jgi:hypothetical protein
VQVQPAYQYPASTEVDAGSKSAPVAEEQATVLDDPLDRNPGLHAYRGRTVGLLRKYLRCALEAGRLPSVLGSEFFRTRVTSYKVGSFEDRVIFVHDMETCVERLDEFSQQLIARSVLQEHDRWATARLLHCNEKTVRRLLPVALDLLSEILLEVGVMQRMDSVPVQENTCQEGETGQFLASDCEHGK